MLASPIGKDAETGDNPRILEVEQVVRLMNIVAEEIYEGQYDLERGAYQIEAKVQRGEDVPEGHLRAFRTGKEEVMGAWLRYVDALVRQYHLLLLGTVLPSRGIFQIRQPEPLWDRLRAFIRGLGGLPLWVNRDLSSTAFGGKQLVSFWEQVFSTGKTPQGVPVLIEPIKINQLLGGNT